MTPLIPDLEYARATRPTRRWLQTFLATGVLVCVLCVLIAVYRPTAAPPLAIAVRTHDSVTRVAVARIDEHLRVAAAAAHRETTFVRAARSSPTLPTLPPQDVILLQDSALAAADVQITAMHAAFTLSELRAESSDSLLHETLYLSGERCRILRVIPCPTRVAVAATTGIAVALALRRWR